MTDHPGTPAVPPDPVPSVPSFAAFFRALHGVDPFPWQERLAATVGDGRWPETLALPTAAGKTACLDIATWALAREAALAPERRAMPRRIVLVVDRRLVVDDAFARARKIAAAVTQATGGPLLAVREALERLGGEIPLHATVLRGGLYRDERWARTPLQPTLVVSTVDQVGSRLLFRGYGLSEGMRPVHAGLLAYDTLLLLDEAHLSRPFEETLEWIAHHRRQGEAPVALPFVFARMTATPPPGTQPFAADAEDWKHPVLGRRLNAAKPTRLLPPVEPKKLAATLADQAAEHAARGDTVAVVVNRVATARAVFDLLRERAAPPEEGKKRKKNALDADVILLTGRSRPHERDALIARWGDRLRSGRDRVASAEARPLLLVSTQCIEAGADVDFDFLVTECAPLDALRQRFGRLDRLGELPPPGDAPRAAIVIDAKNATNSAGDPVYGEALRNTWAWLQSQCADEPDGSESDEKKPDGAMAGSRVDFGIAALRPPEDGELESLLAPRATAPLLQRAYCDLFAQTSPEPVPSPEPAAFLHGIERNDPEVQLVWRADLGNDPDLWPDVVALCPPVVGETLAVRLSVVRAWLRDRNQAADPDDTDLEGLAPVQETSPKKPTKKTAIVATQPKDEAEDDTDETGDEAEAPEPQTADAIRPVLRWVGIENSEVLRDADRLRPGDTLVLPSGYGGCDAFGWSPADTQPVADIAHTARLAAQRAPVLRLHPGLGPAASPLAALTALREVPEEGLRETVAEALAAFRSPAAPADPVLSKLVGQLGGNWRVDLHPAGGVVLTGKPPKANATFSDADDMSSSRAARISLADHGRQVGEEAARYATHVGLDPGLVETLRLAGRFHDLGKADPRFQAWIAGGSRLHALREGKLLAKSERAARRPADIERARVAAGYPKGARHELLSARLLDDANAADLASGLAPGDRELLLHLVASHHGRCRPFAPVVEDPDPVEVEYRENERVLAASSATRLERLDSGVARRFFRLVRRHGWWGLAYLETLLRLADHRVSERNQPEED